MFRFVLSVTIFLAVGNKVAGESCGTCVDEPGSACWTTKAKRDAHCKDKGWDGQHYCGRVLDGCGGDTCHCCGSKLNSRCQPPGEFKSSGTFSGNGYKCFPSAGERDKNCAKNQKRCQAYRLKFSYRQGRNNYYHNDMTYCCVYSAYPDFC